MAVEAEQADCFHHRHRYLLELPTQLRLGLEGHPLLALIHYLPHLLPLSVAAQVELLIPGMALLVVRAAAGLAAGVEVAQLRRVKDSRAALAQAHTAAVAVARVLLVARLSLGQVLVRVVLAHQIQFLVLPSIIQAVAVALTGLALEV
jgi:hypothetical protein